MVRQYPSHTVNFTEKFLAGTHVKPFHMRTRSDGCCRVQVKSEFVAILREGWLQYRKEPKSLLKSWKVGWFELLADGKLAWYPSPSKKPHETRYPAGAGLLHVQCWIVLLLQLNDCAGSAGHVRSSTWASGTGAGPYNPGFHEAVVVNAR